jgi:hypothetical protein
MDRFSRWASSPQAFVVLAVLFAIGAVLDAALGHRTGAIVSGLLAVALLLRARQRHSQ